MKDITTRLVVNRMARTAAALSVALSLSCGIALAQSTATAAGAEPATAAGAQTPPSSMPGPMWHRAPADFAKFKARRLDHLERQIAALTSLQSCVKNAQDFNEFKGCHPQHGHGDHHRGMGSPDHAPGPMSGPLTGLAPGGASGPGTR